MSTASSKRRKLNSSTQSNIKSKDVAPTNSAEIIPELVPSEESGRESSDSSSQPGEDSEHDEDGRPTIKEQTTEYGPVGESTKATKTFKDLVSVLNFIQVRDI
jgi:hypothetical protein